MHKPRLYYSVPDEFPPFRVDIAELFTIITTKYDVEITWYMASDMPHRKGKKKFKEQYVNLPLTLAPTSMLTKIFNKLSYWFFDAFYFISLLFKKVDLIQCRDKYFAALIGLVVAKIKGISYVYWLSYPFPAHDLDLYSRSHGLKRYYYWFRSKLGAYILYELIIPKAEHSFVQSDEMLNDIADTFEIPKQKMTPVPMGVPNKALSFSGDMDNKVEGRIVYLGTLAAIRKLTVLIDAFKIIKAQHQNVTLLIIGNAPFDHERKALEDYVAKQGLENDVEFTGFLPIESAWTLTSTAEICVSPIYPSPILNVGSPTKLIEYMALGLPVVCNRHPEQEEIIKESGVGLCVEWSAQEFAVAIKWMLDHKEEAKAMGQKGPEWVRQNRTYSLIADKVWQQYKQIFKAVP